MTPTPIEGRQRRAVARWVTAATGLLLLAAGATGVYLDHDGFGTVAVVSAGAVLYVASLVIDRLKSATWKGTKVEFYVDQARRLREVGDEESAQDYLDAAVDSMKDQPGVDPESYEKRVLALIQHVSPSDTQVALPARGRGWVDAILRGPGALVGLEVRAGTNFNISRVTFRFLEALRDEVLGLNSILVVVPLEPGDFESEVIESHMLSELKRLGWRKAGSLRVVGWRPGDPSDHLVGALRQLTGADPPK